MKFFHYNNRKQIKDQIDRAIAKYQLHPNILVIKNKIINPYAFCIEPVTLPDVEREITKKNKPNLKT